MLKLATKTRNNVEGYTLIEILVVMFIILIVSGVVTLSVGHFTQRNQIKRFTEQLFHVLPLAKKYATLQPAVLRLSLREKQVSFYQYCITCKRGERWQLLEKPHYLKPINVPTRAVLFLKLEDEANQEQVGDEPLLEISEASGLAPFDLKIGTKDDPNWYSLVVSDDGEVVLHEQK